jgi:LmbE family N-acetylglucosaminyl deacetylase
MDWIYLSPHLDDVALSLGGLLWEQSNNGEKTSIWTICAGSPPPGEFSRFAQSLHERWETGDKSMDARRMEDIDSCEVLGSLHYHINIPDCIYRRSLITGDFLYDSEEDLNLPVHPDEYPLIEELSQNLTAMLPDSANVICPLGIGSHIDHVLTREAVEQIFATPHNNKNRRLFYYADFPYVVNSDLKTAIKGFDSTFHPISSNGIRAWQDSVSKYKSQISTFWCDIQEMRDAIQSYYDQWGGIWLGKK